MSQEGAIAVASAGAATGTAAVAGVSPKRSVARRAIVAESPGMESRAAKTAAGAVTRFVLVVSACCTTPLRAVSATGDGAIDGACPGRAQAATHATITKLIVRFVTTEDSRKRQRRQRGGV